MGKCGKACPYNTLDGCKVKEYRAICPLTNMATPITEYKMTNADRIRAMSDEELAVWMTSIQIDTINEMCKKFDVKIETPLPTVENTADVCDWLKQPAE